MKKNVYILWSEWWESAEMIGFSRVLGWCGGGEMIFRFWVRDCLENSLTVKVYIMEFLLVQR